MSQNLEKYGETGARAALVHTYQSGRENGGGGMRRLEAMGETSVKSLMATGGMSGWVQVEGEKDGESAMSLEEVVVVRAVLERIGVCHTGIPPGRPMRNRRQV